MTMRAVCPCCLAYSTTWLTSVVSFLFLYVANGKTHSSSFTKVCVALEGFGHVVMRRLGGSLPDKSLANSSHLSSSMTSGSSSLTKVSSRVLWLSMVWGLGSGRPCSLRSFCLFSFSTFFAARFLFLIFFTTSFRLCLFFTSFTS